MTVDLAGKSQRPRTLMPIVLETHREKWNLSVTDKVSFGPKGLYIGGWSRSLWNDVGL